MKYEVYLNTRKLNANEKNAIAEYAKRLSAYCKINLHCQPAKSHMEILSSFKSLEHTLLILVQPGSATVSSEEFAEQINQLGIQGTSKVCFLIGYSDMEVPDTTIDFQTLALSTMTMSTGLTGIVLYEQLYRCYRILNNQPYHK